MKKIVLFAALSAMFFIASCNSCGSGNSNGVIIESETDSIYWVNDSTLADAQTFVFEGTTPMDNNGLAEVVLAVRTISLNDDGTYSITTDYVDEGLATQTDNGEAILVMVMSGDSTATIIELVSANSLPTQHFRMQSDSSLVKIDSTGKPVSKDPAHKLTIKK